MKKSKLLIPAIAFLVVSMAAAATSTVAWFTATTTVTSSLSNLIAASAEGSLKVDYQTTAALGFKTAHAYGTYGTEATLGELNVLRDCSINLTTPAAPTAWSATKNADGTIKDNSFDSVDYTSSSKDPKSSYYFFAKFDLKFKVETTDAAMKNDIILSEGSLATLATEKIYSSVRVGIVQGTNYHVWAPGFIAADNGTPRALSFVTSATAADTTTYTYTESATAGQKSFKTIPTTYTYDSTTVPNYIGRVTGSQEIEASFYVWFEGTDADCVVDKISATAYTLSMKFAAVKGPTA